MIPLGGIANPGPSSLGLGGGTLSGGLTLSTGDLTFAAPSTSTGRLVFTGLGIIEGHTSNFWFRNSADNDGLGIVARSLALQAGGSAVWDFAATGIGSFTSVNHLQWASTAVAGTSPDIGLVRNSAGVLRISNASTGIGALLSAVRVSAPGTSGLTAAESGATFTNEGAVARVDFTLPTAVAGYCYTFFVQDTDGVRVIAASGDTIRVGASVSAAAGRIDNATIGGAVQLTAINATEWVANYTVGTWTVT